MTKFALILGCALLSACATRYSEPKDGTPTAVLTTVHLERSFPSWTTVTVFDNLTCTETPGSGRLSRIGKAYDLSESPKASTVRADQRLLIAVDGFWRGDHATRGLTVSHTDYNCINLVSFTPQQGKAYTVTQQIFPGNRCIAKVIDADTRAPAPDLQLHPTPSACIAKGL
jgi:hypothetical protein